MGQEEFDELIEKMKEEAGPDRELCACGADIGEECTCDGCCVCTRTDGVFRVVATLVGGDNDGRDVKMCADCWREIRAMPD